MDVGCGGGLLLERLAPRCAEVVGLEPDPATADRARARTAGLGPVRVETTGLLEWDAADGSADVVCAVASLHHLDLVAALHRVERLLRPGGLLVVVGLAREQGWAEHVAGAAALVGARLLSARHGAAHDPGAPVHDPALSWAETREVYAAVLPGGRLRRRALWRYGVVWRRPG